jgi:hypothetical protein
MSGTGALRQFVPKAVRLGSWAAFGFGGSADDAIGEHVVSYLKGWAEANFAKIPAATTPDYRFHDPFVGSFSRWSLHEYFDLVLDRLCCAGAISRPDIAFFLWGPMDSRPGQLQFWREAPRIGLTGITQIEIAERGVIAESVAYDLNVASHMLRAR